MLAQARLLRTAVCCLFIAIAAGADAPGTAGDDKRLLAPHQVLVGEWRGVGQPKRGSSVGAWTEEAEWAWCFEKGHAELVCVIRGSKYFRTLRLQAGEKPDQLVLMAEPLETNQAAAPRKFVGGKTSDGLVFTAIDNAGDGPARISLRLVAGGDRLLALVEKRVSASGFARLAEVGSTRKGSSFAKNATSGPECVVTGGLGRIAVEHQGKTYYVCCGGCRDLFNDDPQRVLAEYHDRKAAERGDQSK